MRTPPSLTISIVAALAFLSLLNCHAEQTNMFPHMRYASVDVRVVDASTSLPVVGATVKPICLGGTPYATNSYRTDNNGIARVRSFEHMTAVNVVIDGYREASYAFFSTNGAITNALVRLKRVEK